MVGGPLRNPLLRWAWYERQKARLLLPNVRGFEFRGARLHFLAARYNGTWANERQVEVPVVRHLLRGSAQAGDTGPQGTDAAPRMLEVGNVLAHYGLRGHVVVDKYEHAPGSLNQDFLDHRPAHRYHVVVSISTFEHIGWDEPDHDPTKFWQALRRAEDLLEPCGLLVFTVPLGYNPEVDTFARQPPAGYEVTFLERTGPGPGQWQEAQRCDPSRHPYSPTRFASAVAVATWRRPTASPAPSRV